MLTFRFVPTDAPPPFSSPDTDTGLLRKVPDTVAEYLVQDPIQRESIPSCRNALVPVLVDSQVGVRCQVSETGTVLLQPSCDGHDDAQCADLQTLATAEGSGLVQADRKTMPLFGVKSQRLCGTEELQTTAFRAIDGVRNRGRRR